ncbi:MAG: hypothetical protein WA672_18490 [Candidatus Angelobacter sp.]
MMEDQYSPEQETNPRRPEVRYSYYRRCQVFRNGGEQCKAPAEKGSHICYAHAGQQAMALRRDLERRVVLAQAVAEMRRQGHTECELENLLMDFKGIQVTLAVMARAIIGGRIDCKTAGRLIVHLQMMSKLLWTLQKSESLPLINTDNTDLQDVAKDNPAANEREKTRIVLMSPRVSSEKAEPQARKYRVPDEIVGRVDEDTVAQIRLGERGYRDRGQAHGPPNLKAA